MSPRSASNQWRITVGQDAETALSLVLLSLL